MKKLENLAAKGAQITARSDGSVVFKTTSEVVSSSPTTAGTLISNPPLANKAPGGQNYRLLMDPRTGRIFGTINNSGNIQNIQGAPGAGTTLLRPPTAPNLPRMPLPPTPTSRIQATSSIQARSNIRPVTKPSPPPVAKPAAPVKPAQVVDLTRSTTPSAGPASSSSTSSSAVTKNKFPALMVHPKPQDSQMNFKRPELDQKVKSLLVLTPAKLTEWLIKEGLVFQEQNEHGIKLKLGMYQDAKKFPNSGGYVWLCDDAKNKFISVFRGSLFETIIQTPAVVLKLIYHWVCQTSLNNVVAWVKVDHLTVDTFYRHLRCVCISTVQDEIINLGGPERPIELGVISLGTTTTDGNRREVKVEVLGVLERGTNRLR